MHRLGILSVLAFVLAIGASAALAVNTDFPIYNQGVGIQTAQYGQSWGYTTEHGKFYMFCVLRPSWDAIQPRTGLY